MCPKPSEQNWKKNNGTHPFCSHPVGQHLVAWLPPDPGGARQCFLLGGLCPATTSVLWEVGEQIPRAASSLHGGLSRSATGTTKAPRAKAGLSGNGRSCRKPERRAVTGNGDERQQRARLSPFKRGQGFHPEGEWWVTAAEGSAESSSEAASESSGRCGDHLGTRAADARGWAARPVPRLWCPAGGDVASEKVQE